MPTATPVSTEAPSRPGASARAGGTRPSGSGFSDQLAQTLAAPAPGTSPPHAPTQPAAAEKSAPPASAAAQVADSAPAASEATSPAPVADSQLPASRPSGAADGQDAVAAAQPEEAEPDEHEADSVPAEAMPSDPVVAPPPVPQPAAGAASAPVAAMPEASPGEAPSDAARASADAAAAAPASEKASEPATEKAPGERDPFSPDAGALVAGQGQTVPPHAGPQLAPNATDAALSALQPHAAPAHTAKAETAPTQAAPAPLPPAPAAQVAPAVAALVSAAPNGAQRIVVRLDPIELGQVEVRMERAEGGPAIVALTVERPETLLLLVRDQAGLHRALDQAGVPAEGRTVQFQLGQQDPGAPGQQRNLDAGGGWGGFGGHGARQGRGEANRGWRHFGAGDEADPSMRAAWGRAGVDITA